jgi:hypothetical protein
MATHDSASTVVSQALEVTAQAREDAPCYCPPQLFVAGSVIELVQGTYGPYNDISGYYTYG